MSIEDILSDIFANRNQQDPHLNEQEDEEDNVDEPETDEENDDNAGDSDETDISDDDLDVDDEDGSSEDDMLSGSGIEGGDFENQEDDKDDTNTNQKKKDPEVDIDVGDEKEDENLTDLQKVEKLFTDTGDVDKDYNANSEANRRLAKFKFIKAEINIDSLFAEEEKETGLPVNTLEDRLSPEQRERYLKSNQKLRNEYEKIKQREINVAIYNTKVPIVTNNEDGDESNISPGLRAQAYNKIAQYMDKRFGKNWVDKRTAIKFLSTIKVNFSDKDSIRPNLINADVFQPGNAIDNPIIPFNKIRVDIPKTIDDFVRNNLNNDDFKKSSIFRSLSSDYLDSDSTPDTIYAIIVPDEVESEPQSSDVEDIEEPEEDIGDENGEETEDEDGIEI